jgi:peptide/nickel transport system substrate-binding protein
MDPQLSYTGEGWTAMYNTYIPLLTYRHAEGTDGSEVIPGLARALPEITDGGTAYALVLRSGLRYSDGRPVRASDFRFAIERMFLLRSGGSVFYEDIAGVADFLAGRNPHISGIVVDDSTGRIEIRLLRPRATFSHELALLFAAPVPTDTPIRDQTSDPPPAAGPYLITESTPPTSWSYARNPEWNRVNARLLPELPRGYVERMRIEVLDSLHDQVEQVEEGTLDWMYDPPPVDSFARVQAKYVGIQFRPVPTASLYYFWMNTTRPPFDRLAVRQAINHAVDAQALRRIYAGHLAPSRQILPAGVPGHRRFNLYPHDPEKARDMVAGSVSGATPVTVWTDDKSPDSPATEYYVEVLRELGFSARLNVVSTYTYFKVIGNPTTPDLDTGFSNWFQDYPHPNTYFEPIFAVRPRRSNNTNLSQLRAPKLDRVVAELGQGDGVIDQDRYAALDRGYMELAPIVPFGARVRSVFVSSAVDLDQVIWNPTFEVDMSSLRFKAEIGEG